MSFTDLSSPISALNRVNTTLVWFVDMMGLGDKYWQTDRAGVSLRGGGWGFPPATMNMALGYFQRKITEK